MTSTAKSQGPLFTRRALFTLIWPLLLEQTLSVTMGMADTLMVAGVGEAAVSSVSLVDSLNILIIQILSALATGGAVIASQYLGRRDEENASRSAAQLYSVLGISTVAVGVVCMLLSRLILRMVFGSIDEDVMRFAQQYFLISAVSYPFIGLYNGGAALFRAQGNSRISMLASLVMNVINIAGNALLIYGFGMGVIGAALATLIGRVSPRCHPVAEPGPAHPCACSASLTCGPGAGPSCRFCPSASRRVWKTACSRSASCVSAA